MSLVAIKMSREHPDGRSKQPRCTRGEKCIYIHLIVTLVLTLVLLIIYVVHLCVVKHSGSEMFRITRRSSVARDVPEELGSRVGAVMAAGRRACGSVAVRARWSLAPGHCAAARLHPALARLLPTWALRYHLQTRTLETAIKRSVVHSHFNKDDLQHNVGLFEHADPIPVDNYPFDQVTSVSLLDEHTEGLTLLTWNPNYSPNEDKESEASRVVTAAARLEPRAECGPRVAPVRDLEHYEFCAFATDNSTMDHGAALMLGTEVKGFFSWGDKDGRLPLVMLDIAAYKDWIQDFITLPPV